MDKRIPAFMSDEQIRDAARETFEKHGPNSLRVVSERISILRSEGFHSFADTWQLVQDEILRMKGVDSYRDALNKSVTLSE